MFHNLAFLVIVTKMVFLFYCGQINGWMTLWTELWLQAAHYSGPNHTLDLLHTVAEAVSQIIVAGIVVISFMLL